MTLLAGLGRVRRCTATQGGAWHGQAWHGEVPGDWQAPRFEPSAPTRGEARRDQAGRGYAGLGAAWRCKAWHGMEQEGASGTHPGSSPGRARLGMATAVLGPAGLPWARHGSAWQGERERDWQTPGFKSPARTPGLVLAGLGGARLCSARRGMAPQGAQRVTGSHQGSRPRHPRLSARHGLAGMGLASRGAARSEQAGDRQSSGFETPTPTKRVDNASTGAAGTDHGRTLGREANTMHIELVGTQPLLMHNIRLADDQDPYVEAIKALTAKRSKKTADDKLEIDRLSFAGGLYWDEDLGPYLPAENIFRSLMEAGSLTREGKKIERGVVFHQTRAQLEYVGPRDIESLWGENGKSRYVDRRMVAVQRQRIPRVRPIFPEWAASISVEIDTEVIDLPSFESIVSKAGRMIGLGDYRRFYGKFNGKVIA